jgi:hypothetical protein
MDVDSALGDKVLVDETGEIWEGCVIGPGAPAACRTRS